jgi:4-hydroxy-3-methylbut-2-enyl diphosphate reductase
MAADLPTPQTVLLASPRGWCAGVERAVDAVRQTLELHGPPIYVRKQIVHNIHVVRELEAKGVTFVESESEVPEGSTVILSAHGVAPEVHERSASRQLNVIDATCPLVTKVHKEALKYANAGYTIVLIGHEGHEEVVGTMGEAPDAIVLVGSEEEVDALEIGDPEKIAYITQTTLSVDETIGIIERLKARYPQIEGPAKADICYATSNRQQAVKELAAETELVLVIGSGNSSNTNRLVDVAQEAGLPAYRIDDETQIEDAWLEGIQVVGITSGASAPESLVDRVCEFFRARGTTDIRPQKVVDEGVHFMLPSELRTAMRDRAMA